MATDNTKVWQSRNRREFIQTAGSAAGALLLTGLPGTASAQVTRRAIPPNASRFIEPQVERSQYGLLETTLKVNIPDNGNRIGQDRVFLRSYNGGLTGSTLRVKPGDTIKVHLHNNLPTPTGAAHHSADMNIPHDFNVTNLHVHGVHVSPSGNSDNVLIKVAPGGYQQYEFNIPKNHPAGTYWYHAHHHGASALQLSSGMSGILIIEGDIDQVPEIKTAEEKVFLFNQIPYDENGQVEYTPARAGATNPFEYFSFIGNFSKLGRFTTVNGQPRPILYMRPGEVQRWRFIHAGVAEMMDIALQGHKLNPIAYDGITTGTIDAVDSVLMAPGNRADVMVKAGAPGEYELRKLAKTGAETLIEGMDEPMQVIANIIVAGPPVEMSLPNAKDLQGLAPFKSLKETPESVTQRMTFGAMTMANGQAATGLNIMNVNGKRFDGTVNRTLKLGRVDKWILNAGFSKHPFHIHVNPFQVVDIKNKATGQTKAGFKPYWCDTVMVRSDEEVTVLTHYEDFTGTFVQHCHILPHEDMGMMELIEIVR